VARLQSGIGWLALDFLISIGRFSSNNIGVRVMKSTAFFMASTLAVTVLSVRTASAAAIRVAYAGSMGAVMDQQIGPAFEKMHEAAYQGVGQGSYALAHLLASKQMHADVFISITPGRCAF
jgi:molybdate/tungstate transport system substrate-binding protein